ncbi:MAG TPA: aspartate aminotransferase family protein [Syntrophales bacterium]|nr:aspartate aminotransferase family protein [Syntrophales bacterium]
MKEPIDTIAIEDRHTPPFFTKIPLSIERGEGIYVWDESGKRYIDFTAGWGVACLGHAHPAIARALTEQGGKIIQNPNSGLTYSPARARLIALMTEILPPNLTRIFFSNSGAEANDAVIKLARKVTGRMDVVSTEQSFHGRTISTASATGQAKHRERFNPLMPNYLFVPYGHVGAIAEVMGPNTAAVILEPIQGEGGVNVPPEGYLRDVEGLCRKAGACLIVDEVQTGFCRTGPMFAVTQLGVRPDFMTLAKGIAGGFPFGAFALTEEVSARLEKGDHGGTYCGNPLGCAVAYAVIRHLRDNDIEQNVMTVGEMIHELMLIWKEQFPGMIVDVRGRGLLLAMEMAEAATAERIFNEALKRGLILNLIQSKVIRLCPPLNITPGEAEVALSILDETLEAAAQEGEHARSE